MPGRASFDYAVIRVVPRVEREEFVNVGVVLFSRERAFLGCRVAVDAGRLRAFAPDLELEGVEEQLANFRAVCAGDGEAGELAGLSLAERFHWLVSPRSTVVQLSPVHSGLSEDPEAEIDHLLESLVRRPKSTADHPQSKL